MNEIVFSEIKIISVKLKVQARIQMAKENFAGVK
jgi:hypothetical protein